MESNIAHVNAPQAWALGYTGAGLVVANIDTGVRYTHQALVNQYRGNLGNGSFNHNYNWYDPNFPSFSYPYDDHGHGTHTMGTMLGADGAANQIGMAPGAQWIACRGCATSSCTDAALLACAQFVAAPTNLAGSNANPSLRAHVVNNSWGDCGQTYDDWYQDVVDTWQAAGIYPVFSNGNASNCAYSAPPGLNTVGNPARYGNVTGVGSTGNSNGLYAAHSNWGPTDNADTVNPKPGFDNMKPQVVAPGVNIRSAIPTSDSSYQSGWTGTSMSAPHVSGLVALMWQAGACLIGIYAQTETLIEDTATPIVYDDGSALTPDDYPNFAAGWGEIDALAAVTAARDYCTGDYANIRPKPLSFSITQKKDQVSSLNLTLSNIGLEPDSFVILTDGQWITDGSFESGRTADSPWIQFSENFGSPLCTISSCGTGGGTTGPRTGSWWSWFGGYSHPEYAFVTQVVQIPDNNPQLLFHLRLGSCGNPNDYLAVYIDENEIFKINATGSRCGETLYMPSEINLLSFGDNGNHELMFFAQQTTSATTNINLDDVSIITPSENPISWLRITPESGIVTPGQPEQISLTIDTSGLLPGFYYANLEIRTSIKVFTIPVYLYVTKELVFLPLILR